MREPSAQSNQTEQTQAWQELPQLNRTQNNPTHANWCTLANQNENKCNRQSEATTKTGQQQQLRLLSDGSKDNKPKKEKE